MALNNVRRLYGERLVYCDQPYETLQGADALAIVTEWNDFRNPNFAVMRRLLARPIIFDGRNLYDEEQVTRAGFTYYYIGQPDHPAEGHRSSAF